MSEKLGQPESYESIPPITKGIDPNLEAEANKILGEEAIGEPVDEGTVFREYSLDDMDDLDNLYGIEEPITTSSDERPTEQQAAYNIMKEQDLPKALDTLLNESEAIAVKKHFGVSGEEQTTFAKIGKDLPNTKTGIDGVSKNRARQQNNMGLRKLRQEAKNGSKDIEAIDILDDLPQDPDFRRF